MHACKKNKKHFTNHNNQNHNHSLETHQTVLQWLSKFFEQQIHKHMLQMNICFQIVITL